MRAITLAAAAVLLAAAPAGGDDPTVVLHVNGFWRCHLTRGSELVRLKSGELSAVHDLAVYERVKEKGRLVERLRRQHRAHHWPLPPEGWTRVEFDDGGWALADGPFGTGTYKSPSYWYRSIPLLCLRGTFELDDPQGVTDARLSLGVHGGAVVYLNGRELTRIALPGGEIDPLAPAEDYPTEAFLTPGGELLSMRGPVDMAKHPRRFDLRVRRVKDLAIRPDRLRRGLNVLALEIHRAAAAEVMFTGQAKGITRADLKERYAWWPRAALLEAKLSVRGGVAKRSGRALHVWSYPLAQRLTVDHRGGPAGPPRAVRIVGARSGAFSGQIVAAAGRPLKRLAVTPSALTGPAGASIPSSAVQVRFARPDGRAPRSPDYFHSLAAEAPEEVPLRGPEAFQPVWLTVQVPADAPAGEYTGSVAVRAAGEPVVRVPVALRVHGWRVPDSKEFFTFVGLFESPDTVAMRYKAPMWSDRHWKLLDRSFRQMGRVGAKTVYVTAIRQTHLGNAHGMIRFTRGGDGRLRPDFRVAERYLDLAVRHLGKVPVVALYCWETFDSGGRYHFGHYARKDRPILISVLDPKTGEPVEETGPAWGTEPCRAFWKPVFDGLRAILAKRGLAGSLMAGVAGDFEPTEAALGDIRAASGGVPWVSHSHTVRHGVGPKRDHPTGYIASAWGGHANLGDPDEWGRAYGWRNDFHRVMTRGFPSEPTTQRLCLEKLVCSRIMPRRKVDRPEFALHGIGRLGADFWPVLGGASPWRGSILARYPEARWGQLNVALYMPALFAPGPDGAIATVASEMFRENHQEIEARIFLEKALLDPARRARLGEPLAARCQRVLDDRVRMILRATGDRALMGPAWQVMSDRLYAAAEAAEKLRPGQ